MTEPDDSGDDEVRSIAPFVAALAIFVVVVIAIVVLSFTGGDGLTDDERVGRAAVGQNDALQRGDYADFRDYTCAQYLGSEDEILSGQRDSVAKRGARYVDDVTAVMIDNDRATAIVVYHFDKVVDTTSGSELSFVREGGSWKVCSPTSS